MAAMTAIELIKYLETLPKETIIKVVEVRDGSYGGSYGVLTDLEIGANTCFDDPASFGSTSTPTLELGIDIGEVEELKDYIIEDTNRINIILEDINCHGIREYGKDFRCGLPNHQNTTSVRVRKQTLSVAIYQADDGKVNGDIFTLIMHVKEMSFPQSIRYVHKLLNLEYTIYGEVVNIQPKNHILSMFRNIRKETKSITNSKYDFNTSVILQ